MKFAESLLIASVSAQATCAGVPYDETIYSCTSDMFLCPKPTFGCGTTKDKFACYAEDQYDCLDGQLVPEGTVKTTTSVPATTTPPVQMTTSKEETTTEPATTTDDCEE